MNLEDRSAIITGASQGLGKAIATSFVQAGASVLLMARGEALLHEVRQELTALATRRGQQILIMRGNVAEPESCNAAVRYAQEALPNLTVLVNNAGVYGPMGRIEKVDWQAWVEAVQINLFGTVLMCRAIIPLFRARGYGKIINLSGGGATAPLPCISAYAASKVAIVRLTETFAEELRDAHIDVNAIAPGALNTRMLEDVLLAGPEKVGKSFYERSVEQRDKGGVPLETRRGFGSFPCFSSQRRHQRPFNQRRVG